MKKIIPFLFYLFIFQFANAQEAFTVSNYSINVVINKNASLDVTEDLEVHFSEARHGIIRSIQYQYPLEQLPAGIEKGQRQMEANGYSHILLENIKVPGNQFTVKKAGDYENIKIGSANKLVNGNQHYIIKYRLLNVINFFKNHSEFYFNLLGNQWNTSIDSVSFKIILPEALDETPYFFVYTGSFGSKDNNSEAKWIDRKIFEGHTIKALKPYEGVTVGISFPKDFLVQQDYTFSGIWWLLLPLFVFFGMRLIWKKWGKDEKVTIQTEYYPPENISPSISGYIIDDKLDRRDLTALIPYWGANGYLQVNELEKNSFLGMIKSKDYEFVKVHELLEVSYQFEKTLFKGIFKTGDRVKLDDLKNVLYITMDQAKSELETEINHDDFYVKFSRGLGCLFPFIGILCTIIGSFTLIDNWQQKLWLGLGLIASGIILVSFGVFMSKKTKKGTLLYQKLLGFKEFIKTVEKDRLAEFLKQDENYFDKVLPYAIVFDMADKWKDKLKGLEVPPPKWFSGNYAGTNFNTMMFMNSLDHSMNQMTHTFYSAPSSSGTSGGSFSGGGGFSGGGFGGGGGSSW
ncbi:MAG: DUF2207 domain-containing protein [Ginsengibacter sp.]